MAMDTPKHTPTPDAVVMIPNQGKLVPHKTPTVVIPADSSVDSTPTKSTEGDQQQLLDDLAKEADNLETELSQDKKDKNDSGDPGDTQ